MKYIIIVDNNISCGNALKALLQCKLKNETRTNYMIATWNEHSYDNIELSASNLCVALQKIYNDTDNNIHFLIDLLLTPNEENQVDVISNKLTSKYNDTLIASGIQFANKILNTFEERINISFMSKWLNLQNGILINEYNGIRENNLWDNRTVRSFLNPINENSCIINRTLQMPQDNAKTVVDVAVNIAFNF